MTSDLDSLPAPDEVGKAWTLTPPDAAIWTTLRRQVKAVSLDLWGTLLDDQQAPVDTVLFSEERQGFLLQELQRQGYAFGAKDMKAAYKQAWSYFDDLWARQIAFGAADGVREMLRFLGAELPAPSFWRVVLFFEETFGDQLPRELAGATAAVRKLAGKYPLALISDTAWTPGRVLRGILDHLGILDCFRVMIFSGEVGATKPHPQMFRLALNGLGVKTHECLHVGDLQRTDIAGARHAGMHTAWVCRPVYAGEAQQEAGPEVIVKSVAEIAERLMDT